MTYSEAQYRANNKYLKEKYARINLALPKAEVEAIKEYVKEHESEITANGSEIKSVNGFIRDTLKAAIGYKDPEASEG